MPVCVCWVSVCEECVYDNACSDREMRRVEGADVQTQNGARTGSVTPQGSSRRVTCCQVYQLVSEDALPCAAVRWLPVAGFCVPIVGCTGRGACGAEASQAGWKGVEITLDFMKSLLCSYFVLLL